MLICNSTVASNPQEQNQALNNRYPFELIVLLILLVNFRIVPGRPSFGLFPSLSSAVEILLKFALLLVGVGVNSALLPVGVAGLFPFSNGSATAAAFGVGISLKCTTWLSREGAAFCFCGGEVDKGRRVFCGMGFDVDAGGGEDESLSSETVTGRASESVLSSSNCARSLSRKESSSRMRL